MTKRKNYEEDSYYDNIVEDTNYEDNYNTTSNTEDEYYEDDLEESLYYENGSCEDIDNLDDLESDYYSEEYFRGLMDEEYIDEETELDDLDIYNEDNEE